MIESTRIDTIPLSEDIGPVIAAPEFPKRGPSLKDLGNQLLAMPGPPVDRTKPLLKLTTILCTRFVAQRGISEGELLQIVSSTLGLKVPEIWPILRGWIEAGTLDVLSDARWRARIYFARPPRLVVHRRQGLYEGVLTGLIPPFLLERFDRLSAITGFVPVDRRSASEAVPPLPRCRADHGGLLTDLTRELNLPPVSAVRPVRDFIASVRSLLDAHTSTLEDSWPVFRKWDWTRRMFIDNPAQIAQSGISLHWCRRDDGPDRYKLFRNDSPIWWTRSRTWAVLAAFTLAGVPVFERGPAGVIESRGDSLYLPLPVARHVSWIGTVNPGPVKTEDGRAVYRYTFPDDRVREGILDGLWPSGSVTGEKFSYEIMNRFAAVIRTRNGPLVPLPAALRRFMVEVEEGRSYRTPVFVPASALPELYAILRAQQKGRLSGPDVSGARGAIQCWEVWPRARLRPTFQASPDKTCWLTPEEEFPNSGVVSWWQPTPDADVYRAWIFQVESSRTYEHDNEHHDYYGVKGSPSPAVELIDLPAAEDPEDTRAFLLEEGISLDRCASKRLVFRDRSGSVVGPIELTLREGRLFLDEKETPIPVNHSNEELALGAWEGHRFLPPEVWPRRAGEVDYSPNAVFLKRVLREIREMTPQVIDSARMTERLISSYWNAFDKTSLSPLQRQRLKRLHKLAAKSELGLTLAADAVPDLLSLSAVKDLLSAAKEQAGLSAVEERRAKLNERQRAGGS